MTKAFGEVIIDYSVSLHQRVTSRWTDESPTEFLERLTHVFGFLGFRRYLGNTFDFWGIGRFETPKEFGE